MERERERELAEALLGDEQARREVTEALLEITSRTAANADGEVGVGLSVLVAGAVESIGATTDRAQKMDFGQATDGEGPCLEALASGDLVGVADYATDERWPGTSQRAGEAGIRSSLSLPLKAQEHILGALNVYSNAPNAFSTEAARSLEAFAEQATTSLLLLSRMQAQREDSAYVTSFAGTVQDSLRPVLPHVDGLELTGASVPASPHAAVGGDWFDALELPGGTLGLVIGDVMGHDVAAVTTMAQVRTMVRTAAWAGLEPVALLRLVDQLVNASGISETVTLVYATLNRDDAGAWRLEYCNAGHPAPLLREADGTVRELDGGTRVLIGTIGTGAQEGAWTGQVGTAHLPPGAVLLLFTDGLVERPGVDIDAATAALSRTLAAMDPGEDLDVMRHRLLDQPSPSDDTTILAVRTAPTPERRT